MSLRCYPPCTVPGVLYAGCSYSNEVHSSLLLFSLYSSQVGDVKFNFLKSVESILENTFPDIFRSRYAMVCYGGGGGITYDAALRLGEVQWAILEDLCESIKVPEDVDLKVSILIPSYPPCTAHGVVTQT